MYSLGRLSRCLAAHRYLLKLISSQDLTDMLAGLSLKCTGVMAGLSLMALKLLMKLRLGGCWGPGEAQP